MLAVLRLPGGCSPPLEAEEEEELEALDFEGSVSREAGGEG